MGVGVLLDVLFVEFDGFALFLEMLVEVVRLVGVHVLADLGEQVLVNTFFGVVAGVDLVDAPAG